MRLRITQRHAQFGPRLCLADFNDLAGMFLRHEPDTLQIEQAGHELANAGFPVQQVRTFVSTVCAWGGHAGIAARVLQNNTPQAIAAALQQASHTLADFNHGTIAVALRTINGLHSLGTPSFASKHLRFLMPQRCPVFDSILGQELTYPFTPDGYQEFADDCLLLAQALQERGIVNPAGRQGQWFVADVEMALYAHFRNY